MNNKDKTAYESGYHLGYTGRELNEQLIDIIWDKVQSCCEANRLSFTRDTYLEKEFFKQGWREGWHRFQDETKL